MRAGRFLALVTLATALVTTGCGSDSTPTAKKKDGGAGLAVEVREARGECDEDESGKRKGERRCGQHS